MCKRVVRYFSLKNVLRTWFRMQIGFSYAKINSNMKSSKKTFGCTVELRKHICTDNFECCYSASKTFLSVDIIDLQALNKNRFLSRLHHFTIIYKWTNNSTKYRFANCWTELFDDSALDSVSKNVNIASKISEYRKKVSLFSKLSL